MTIAELLKQVGITEFNKPIKWGKPCPCEKQGVYVISFCAAPNLEMEEPSEQQFDDAAIQKWIDFTDLKLNNKRPTVNEIKKELQRFWLREENILYIGNTTRPLRDRIDEIYQTKQLGKGGPHAGGQWLKTLKNIDELYIHYIPTISLDTKPLLLDYFLNKVGKLPFANLKIQAPPKPKSINYYKKKHNFTKQQE